MIADDYPSMVPFSIQLKGIPLHLCTHQNLETIGDWLGKVDKIYAAEGKIKVYIDSSKPLKFTRKLQTRNKEDINIKLHYEMLFKHCTGCDLMSHGTQDFLKKAIALQNLQVPRETIFDRVCNNPTRGEVREVGIRGTSEVEREKDVTSYKSQRDTSRSASRAPPSKHSEVTKERQWREKQFRPLKISERGSGSVATASQRSEVAPVATKKMHSDSKVTYRSNSVVSDTATTDDLIHHYDALKIDALNDFENDIEEGDAADADMEEAFVGNELMIMEDDDLLGEDLMHTKSPNDNVHEDLGDQHVRNKQDGSFLMIEANKMGDTGEADGESDSDPFGEWSSWQKGT
ncbi:hypothetical protein F2Q69_00022242 [Brassica cretica]|uniref:Zinc knuckle CX2CX4HX4C domain-containing protein n=1 Tax=Brassica cretica TaxID=69181 RepID=A0A8S9Q1S3_BRACR|nr:hypothetical protein F2Q69_00022242 [Brassica cretica]